LLVTAATIHMSLLGPVGLARVAERCHANTRDLVARLTRIGGVSERFRGAFFHERVLTLSRDATEVVAELLDHGILAGLGLGDYFPDMSNDLLVCATEKRTATEIEAYATALEKVLGA
jgi:glycine dehydrogenase subunit 1